jgi:hypothetical protein
MVMLILLVLGHQFQVFLLGLLARHIHKPLSYHTHLDPEGGGNTYLRSVKTAYFHMEQRKIRATNAKEETNVIA